MSTLTEKPLLLKISPEGHLGLSIEQLSQAGLVPGDLLIVSIITPGQLYLRKIETELGEPLSREALSQLLQDAFYENGYTSREEIINLIREVRQEMADER